MKIIIGKLKSGQTEPSPSIECWIPEQYEIEGSAEIAGLCNGDATSLESFKGNRIKHSMGYV